MKSRNLLLSIVLLLLLPSVPVSAEELVVNFEFQTTDEETVEVEDFYGKPILIEWAASWCNVCKQNQEAIGEIYNDYKDKVNFLSISFGLSRDTIEDVQEMKQGRNYNWTFGLDVNKFTSGYDVFNGYNWLLDANGTLLKTWNSTLLSPSELGQTFEDYFGYENQYESEGLIVGSTTLLLLVIPSLLLVPVLRRRRS